MTGCTALHGGYLQVPLAIMEVRTSAAMSRLGAKMREETATATTRHRAPEQTWHR